MRRSLTLILIGFILSTLTTGVVFAREMIQGEHCTVEANEVIDGTFFTFCQTLTINGTVDGNIIGIALRTVIDGDVTGNVYMAGLELDLSGTVDGDLHYVGITLDVHTNKTQNQSVRGQLLFATLSVYVGDGVVIPDRVTGLGYQLVLDGVINQEINFWGSALVINNRVNDNVYATVGNPESDASDLEPLLLPLDIQKEFVIPGLRIGSDGIITGNLDYTGPAEAIVNGTIEGETNYTQLTPVILPSLPEKGSLNIFLSQFAREVTVLLTVGIIGMTIAPNAFQTPIANLRSRPVPSFVIGMLMFIVSFPITLILLLITTVISLVLLLLQLDGILIVISAFLLLVDGGVIGVFYFAAIFVARAIFALGLGRILIRMTIGHDGTHRTNLLSLLVGVILIAGLAALPAVGFVFNAAALFMGLGAITNVVLEWLQAMRDTSFQNAQPIEQASASQPASPAPNARFLTLPADTLGLTDLPEGFDPDFFFNDD